MQLCRYDGPSYLLCLLLLYTVLLLSVHCLLHATPRYDGLFDAAAEEAQMAAAEGDDDDDIDPSLAEGGENEQDDDEKKADNDDEVSFP